MSHVTPNFSSDRATIAWTDEEKQAEVTTSQGTFDDNKSFINTILESKLLCTYKRICQWYETEHLVPPPRLAEDKEQIDLDSEQLTCIPQKQRNMPQARGDSLLLTEKSRDAHSRGFRTSNICRNGGNWTHVCIFPYISFEPVNLLWMKNSSTPLCREYSRSKNSQDSRIIAIRNDHVKIGPTIGIGAFKSAGTLVIEVTNTVTTNRKFEFLCMSRGIKQYARQFIPTETDHQNFWSRVITTVCELRVTASTNDW